MLYYVNMTLYNISQFQRQCFTFWINLFCFYKNVINVKLKSFII